MTRHQFHAFISHASEDKEAVARPLAEILKARGWRVWIDEAELRVGDSLEGRINEALTLCRYGVVILSPAFFEKQWTQRELKGLAAKEVGSGTTVVLPVWHDITYEDLLERAPVLADRFGIRTTKGLDAVADALVRVFDEEAERRRPELLPPARRGQAGGEAPPPGLDAQSSGRPELRLRAWLRAHLLPPVAAGLLTALILAAAAIGFGFLRDDELPAPPDRPTNVEPFGALDGPTHVRILKRRDVLAAYVVADQVAHRIPGAEIYNCSVEYYPVQWDVDDREWQEQIERAGDDARCPVGIEPVITPKLITGGYVLRERRRPGRPTEMWLVVDGQRAPIPDRPTFECLTRRYLMWDYVGSGEIRTFPLHKTQRRARCP
ncbi:MAG TPA: toll/interleukin-1 receptor domain-containing protein [Solirubrobacteraceae bacterium]|jgi:hypothetical protein